MKRWLFLIAAGYLILAGSNASASTKKEKSASKPPVSSADKASPGPAGHALSGKVVETMNSGGYTYVCLENKGKKTWVAVPEMKVSIGQKIALQPGAEMTNFQSKTLNRTFDRIIFSGGPASPQSASGASMAGHGSMGSSAPAGKNIKVEKAAGADAYTVGEIFAKRKALHQKAVAVRGKVVKVSAGIMGANWIHVQDGTGDAEKSTHDLVVTSQELPSVGDVVTLKGTVSIDKDFGAGYRYAVIVEKASIQD
jgi:hypothetical protein